MPIEYNYSENRPQRLQPQPQTVYVQKQNTFNDYLQTGLLAANLVATLEVQRLLQEAAVERKLRWWESVVQHRFPAITDPMLLEDAAKALMAWDARETAAQQQRWTGRQYRHFERGWDFIGILWWSVVGTIFTAIVFLVTCIVSPDGNPYWVAVALAAAFPVYAVVTCFVRLFIGHPPSFNPADGSVICRQFQPGQRITSLDGRPYTVADWPVYQPERLRFTIPVHERIGTSQVKGRPSLTSDQVAWSR